MNFHKIILMQPPLFQPSIFKKVGECNLVIRDLRKDFFLNYQDNKCVVPQIK